MITKLMSRVSDDFWINWKHKDTPSIYSRIKAKSDLTVLYYVNFKNRDELNTRYADEGITGRSKSPYTTV